MMNRQYWDDRYRHGVGSGPGSEGKRAAWKAHHINRLAVGTVLDIGCGGGQQARLIESADYLGVDPSPEALRLARQTCPEKTFAALEDAEPRDTHLSIEVIFHLVDDESYGQHMALLFSARRRVVVFSSNHDGHGAAHVRHRRFSDDVPGGWQLVERVSGHRMFHSDFWVFDC